MSRTFGQGPSAVLLEFRKFAPGNGFELLLAGKILKLSGKTPATIVTEFEPGGARDENNNAPWGTLPDGRSVVQTGGVLLENYLLFPKDKPPPPEELAAIQAKPPSVDRNGETKIARLRISGAIAHPIVLELGPMDQPMDLMRGCIDRLLVKWGIDPAVDRTLTRRPTPRGNPASWISPDDYPKKMLVAGKSAAIHFRLNVDASGKPTACVVQGPDNPGFSPLTCDLMMQHARFEPALDAKGQPIASYFVSALRWRVF